MVLLSAEDTFAGMSWHDAKHAATAIICDAISREDAASFLLRRADRALNGADNMKWYDPAAMARAMTIGAKVLGVRTD